MCLAHGFQRDAGADHSCSVQRCCFHRLRHGTSQQSILDRSRRQPRQSEQTEPDRKSDRGKAQYIQAVFKIKHNRNINNKLTLIKQTLTKRFNYVASNTVEAQKSRRNYETNTANQQHQADMN